jgi:NADH-quinone oxidoreductase subunit J
VVLFLFVIMLLGVDEAEDLSTDPLGGQRPAAAAAGVGILGVALVALFVARRGDEVVTGAQALAGSLTAGDDENIVRLARSLFTDYLFAFEATSILLVIAVVGAVVLARRVPRQEVPGA